MKFREYIKLLEAGPTSGSQPTTLRGGHPYAAAELPPPPVYGISNADHHMAMINWAQSVYQNIIHLHTARRTINIGGKEYIPENEIKRYHIEAIDLLKRTKVLVSDSVNFQCLEVDIEKILQQTNPTPGGELASFIYNELYSKRELINYSKSWTQAEKYYAVTSMLPQTPNTQAGIQELQQAGALGTEIENIAMFELNIQNAIQQVHNRYLINRYLVQPAQAALQSAMTGRMALNPSVAQTLA